MNQLWKMTIPALVGLAIVAPAPVQAQTTPRPVVDQFYRWYVRNQDGLRRRFAEQKNAFTPELYDQLTQAFQKGPQDKAWLDVDPFSDSQMGAKAYSLGTVNVYNNFLANVEVTITGSRGDRGYPIRVVLTNQDGRWRISDLTYTRGGSLLCELQAINQGR